ncbi:MAG: pantetheine-phosphate adenylyltransferase [Acidobacteria bacterium]|nr:pantetheine-phosphate adenylyltransferase [Acidobacteriota bacterium]MDW7984007.1 pantetheine-phosphate adenylyltransferase [Acidobacteriota bacterium]
MEVRGLAVYPGSFDPITNGHLDIIQRCLSVFPRVIVAIVENPEKAPLFSTEERRAIIQALFTEEPRVQVETFRGLLVDFVRQVGAQVIVRGLRAMTDFEYEFQMALMNRRLCPDIETVFLMAGESYSYVSSRLIKEIFRYGGDVAGLVPPIVLEYLDRKRRAGDLG